VSVRHDGAVARRRATLARGAAVRRGAAVAIVVAAAVLALLRLPGAHRDATSAVAVGFGRADFGGLHMALNWNGIDEQFVEVALENVHAGDRFAVLLPTPGSTAIGSLTVQALPPLLLDLLLPAREVTTPVRGDYILCYGCDATRWEGRMDLVWSGPGGLEIGKLAR
jgi:hypothetical protein